MRGSVRGGVRVTESELMLLFCMVIGVRRLGDRPA